tara:strand:- start:2618 stop:2794 length:177 start_codon:yes stop_codon:yes gene_type:complete
MKVELDIKTLITLGGIVAMLGGFVYTTRLRFELIDARIEKVENQQSVMKKRLRPKKKK